MMYIKAPVSCRRQEPHPTHKHYNSHFHSSKLFYIKMASLFTAALLLSATASAANLGSGWPTSGTESGQVRVYSWSQAQEVGCLTADGSWTASRDCDTFTAEAIGQVYIDQDWTQLQIRSSAGNECWFADEETLKLVCDGSVNGTLWVHASNYKSDSESLGSPRDVRVRD
ncbi:hypothetical protein F4804DRAFT_296932 [Jackrogersella minutella]|nr:hypothetical protein F4804DRAFT_296932 [Jackrogersella minutella]